MLENKLAILRTEKGMTKKEVADFLKIDQSAYGKYDLGKWKPSYDTLNQLASLFNTSVTTSSATPISACLQKP